MTFINWLRDFFSATKRIRVHVTLDNAQHMTGKTVYYKVRKHPARHCRKDSR